MRTPGINRFTNPRLLPGERVPFRGGGRGGRARPPQGVHHIGGPDMEKAPALSAEAFMVELSGVEPLTS